MGTILSLQRLVAISALRIGDVVGGGVVWMGSKEEIVWI